MKIALLEDDVPLANLLCLWLQSSKHECHHKNSGGAFINLIDKEQYDLYIIDWNLPDISGIEVLQWIRNNIGWNCPVLFTTGRDNEFDIVTALNHGADDYLVKPVKRNELLARMNVLVRRNQIHGGNKKYNFGIYQVDLNLHTISRDGKAIKLTNKEYELALYLFNNVGKVVSRSNILESVWGVNCDLDTRTVDTHISRLRKKLQFGHDAIGIKLIGIYQHGYRLETFEKNSS